MQNFYNQITLKIIHLIIYYNHFITKLLNYNNIVQYKYASG